MLLTLMRKGDRAEILRFGEAAAINDFDPTDARVWLLLRATFTHAPQHEIHKLAAEAVNYFLPFQDGETNYFASEALAVAGESDGALRLACSKAFKFALFAGSAFISCPAAATGISG